MSQAENQKFLRLLALYHKKNPNSFDEWIRDYYKSAARASDPIAKLKEEAKAGHVLTRRLTRKAMNDMAWGLQPPTEHLNMRTREDFIDDMLTSFGEKTSGKKTSSKKTSGKKTSGKKTSGKKTSSAALRKDFCEPKSKKFSVPDAVHCSAALSYAHTAGKNANAVRKCALEKAKDHGWDKCGRSSKNTYVQNLRKELGLN